MTSANAPNNILSLVRFAVTRIVTAAYLVGIAGTTAAEPMLLNLPKPLRDSEPVIVRAAFDLQDINEINDEQETFEFRGVLTLEWRDERQAFDPAAEGLKERLYQGAYQFHEVFTGWYPQIVLVNESGLYENHGVLLRHRPDGTLRLIQTVNAVAKTDLNLRAYPFDGQRLEAIFEVLGFDESELVLQPAAVGNVSAPRESDAVQVPQWNLRRVSASNRSHVASHAGQLGMASTFVVTLEVERKSVFMLRLVVLPLVLIVVLSWSVFLMDQSSLADRLNLSFVGILTVVAYQIVLSEIMPRISYVTLMNAFLNLSFFIMCASAAINLWVGMLDRSGQSAAGDSIDRRCRWIFPVIYFGSILFLVALTYVKVGF